MHGPRVERERGVFRAVGLGLITGAADDDPSAIGTYAAAGAKLGPLFLWTAPVTLPMMFAVVYLSAKLGQVSGRDPGHRPLLCALGSVSVACDARIVIAWRRRPRRRRCPAYQRAIGWRFVVRKLAARPWPA